MNDGQVTITRADLIALRDGLGELLSFCHGMDTWLTALSYRPETPGRLTVIATNLRLRVLALLGEYDK